VTEELGTALSSSINFLDWIRGDDISNRIHFSGLTANISPGAPRDLISFNSRNTGGNVLLEQMKTIPPSKILRISWNLEIHVISPYNYH